MPVVPGPFRASFRERPGDEVVRRPRNDGEERPQYGRQNFGEPVELGVGGFADRRGVPVRDDADLERMLGGERGVGGQLGIVGDQPNGLPALLRKDELECAGPPERPDEAGRALHFLAQQRRHLGESDELRVGMEKGSSGLRAGVLEQHDRNDPRGRGKRADPLAHHLDDLADALSGQEGEDRGVPGALDDHLMESEPGLPYVRRRSSRDFRGERPVGSERRELVRDRADGPTRAIGPSVRLPIRRELGRRPGFVSFAERAFAG